MFFIKYTIYCIKMHKIDVNKIGTTFNIWIVFTLYHDTKHFFINVFFLVFDFSYIMTQIN
jgi:hypothetical protein